MRGWGFVTVLDPDAAMGEWHAHAARARGSDACSPSKRWPMDAPLVSYVFNGGGPLMSDAQSVPYAVCDTQFEAVTWGLSEIIYFKRAKGALAETMAARAADQISRFYAWLERHLGEETWFSGRDFGWTDLCVVPYVHSAAGFGFLPSPQSALTGWLERCRSRPSIAAAFKAANDAAGVMTAVADVVEAGGFKRQYRDHCLEWMIRSGGLDVVRDGIVRDNIRFNTEPD